MGTRYRASDTRYERTTMRSIIVLLIVLGIAIGEAKYGEHKLAKQEENLLKSLDDHLNEADSEQKADDDESWNVVKKFNNDELDNMLGIHHARTKVPPTAAALQAVKQQEAMQVAELDDVQAKTLAKKGGEKKSRRRSSSRSSSKGEKKPKAHDAREFGAKVAAKVIVEGEEPPSPKAGRRNNLHSSAPARSTSLGFTTLGALLFGALIFG